MKTVTVTFEDGTTQEWPAKEILVHSNEIPPQPPRVELVPIETDEVTFTATIGTWLARKRS